MRHIIHRKTLISMLFIGLSMLGVISYKQLQVDLLPNVELPFLFVQIMSTQEIDPENMENLAVVPVEGAIGTLEGIESIESEIGSGQAYIIIYYEKWVNIKFAYLKLQEKINSIKSSLPENFNVGVNKFDIQQLNSRFMQLQVRGSGGADRVRNIVDLSIKDKLENIDGVSGISVFGGSEKSLEIIVNTQACKAYNISLANIRSVISQNSHNKTYVGNVHEKDKLYFTHVTSEYTDVKQLEELVVASGPILLKDIATVRFGAKEKSTYSRVNGKDAVNISITSDSQANKIDLSHKVKDVISLLNTQLQSKDIEISVESNEAETMEENINQIIKLAIFGGILAIFILWIFLRNFRIVSFIAIAIPVSVFIAFNAFYALDISINSLTLIGIALAIGMLIDNSVVVLENIYRLSGKNYGPDEAVIQGTSEVSRSIIASTLTTITVFVPFIFASNYMIAAFGENIGVSIISTLLVSLAIALLLIPLAIHYLLKRRQSSSIVFQQVSTSNRMIQVYLVFLKSCMRYPLRTILSALVLFFLAIIISLAISASSLKEVEEEQIQFYLTMPSGSTLDKTDESVKKMEKLLEDVKEKEDVISNIQEEEAVVTLKLKEDYKDIDGKTYAELKSELDNKMNAVQSGDISFEQTQNAGRFRGPSRNFGRGFQRMLGIGDNSEKILIKGQDFAAMKSVVAELEYYLNQLESIQRVNVNVSENRPEVHLKFKPILMEQLGITQASIIAELNSFRKEVNTNAKFRYGIEEYDIILKEEEKKTEDNFRSLAELKELEVPGSQNEFHELQGFTDIILSNGLTGISRLNQEKYIELEYSFQSDAEQSNDLLESYRLEIDEIVENMKIPAGIAVEVVHEESDLDDYYFLIWAAIILIFMILASVFESLATPFVLLFSIPFAAIGSLLALIITENSLINTNTLTGFIILIGVVVNNSIILIDYTNILRKKGYRRTRALMTAGLSRVRPILITAITTIVAMMPLAMGDEQYVKAIGAPFAIVVIGGLALSTVLTLVFVPTFYSGLENALEWFKSLPAYLRFSQIAIISAFVLLIYFEVDDTIWKLIDINLIVLLVPGVTWFVRSSLRRAKTRVISSDEPISIKLQNLVKIYDREGRFSREWNSGLKRNKRHNTDTKASTAQYFENLIWQIPLLGFLIYFTYFYVGQVFWIWVLMITISGYCLWLWNNMKKNTSLSDVSKRPAWFKVRPGIFDAFVYWGIPALQMSIFIYNAESLGLNIFLSALWLIGLVIRSLSNYIFSKNINIDRITGRLGGLRRAILRAIKVIPVIGKRYRPFKALQGVSLKIGTGMFGLLGPNGAGKSTMMRIICGVYEQSYGKIWINGVDTSEKREELQGLIGYLPQEFGTYEHMAARDYLDYQAILKGIIDKDVRKQRIDYVLKSVHLDDKQHDKIGSFSGGMKQRVGIAQILLHLPRILVVDEPTAGLDPRERIRFRNLLVQLSKERIVIFSTHIIEDISSSCNKVAVINRGQVKYVGTPVDMVNKANGMVWKFIVPAAEFESIPDKQFIVNHYRQDENVIVKMLSPHKPHPNAVEDAPVLEDAYLCLIKGLKSQ